MMPVLVHSDCYKKKQTGWFINKIIFFLLTVLESEIGVQAWWTEGLFLGCTLLTESSCSRRGQGALWDLFFKTMDPSWSSTLMILPKHN